MLQLSRVMLTVISVGTVWCEEGTKPRKNSLRVRHKNYYEMHPISSDSNCGAGVSEYAEYPVLFFYWISNQMESKSLSLCSPAVT